MLMSTSFRHLFGPVPSRRFGRSLGVDLTPHKTCTQDCVFCQLGPTTRKVEERSELVPTDDVLRELARWNRSGDWADVITLSGSGEPTLHTGFGKVLEAIRASAKAPVVLLSNGSLFWQKEVRDAACSADIVKISLNAWDQESFERIHMPHENLEFDRIVKGIQAFRDYYSGQLWLEVFLVKQLNDQPDDVARIAAIADRIRPDRVHFNTVIRPAAVQEALPVTDRNMKPLTSLFHPKAEIPSDPVKTGGLTRLPSKEDILSLLGRRPSTSRQLANAFSANNIEIVRFLSQLLQDGSIKIRSENGHPFFVPKETLQPMKP